MKHYYASRRLLANFRRGFNIMVKTNDGLVLGMYKERRGDLWEWVMTCRCDDPSACQRRCLETDDGESVDDEALLDAADSALAFFRVQLPLEALASLI